MSAAAEYLLAERCARLFAPLRLQRERIAAFKEFRADVETGAYPEDKHMVPIADAELEAFMTALER